MDDTDKSYVVRMRKMRFLVAEDDEQGAKLIDMVLNKLGAGEIVHAKNGAEAWNHLDNATMQFDLVISDWNMPEMTGIELLEKVRVSRMTVPFVMITGRGTMDSAVEAKTQGVTAYLPKPYTPHMLAQKITAILFEGEDR